LEIINNNKSQFRFMKGY